eukprot:m51a1_g11266 putative calpain family cysteine protease (634) ;mRNA; r:126-2601
MLGTIADCSKRRAMYEDADFAPSVRSLGRDRANDNVLWLRPSEFMADTSLEGARVGDVAQGGLGDVSFLAALCALARTPGLAERVLFREHRPNTCGCYCVSLHLGGEERSVLIDDRIPCDKDTRSPLFSGSRARGLWVMLAEKAYAKLHGSYLDITPRPLDTLADVLGAPARSLAIAGLKSPKHAELWNELVVPLRKGHAILAGIQRSNARPSLEEECGLVEGMVYTVMDAREVGGCHFLVRLHSTRPGARWRGEWDAGDARWTPKLREELGWRAGHEGQEFWMSSADFFRRFTELITCPYEEGWSFSSCRVSIDTVRSEMVVDAKTVSSAIVTLRQQRGVQPQSARLCVRRQEDGAPVGGTTEAFQQSDSVSTGQLQLRPGTYIAVIEFIRPPDKRTPVIASVDCYSSAPTKVSKGPPGRVPLEFVIPDFMAKYGPCSACNQPLPTPLVYCPSPDVMIAVPGVPPPPSARNTRPATSNYSSARPPTASLGASQGSYSQMRQPSASSRMGGPKPYLSNSSPSPSSSYPPRSPALTVSGPVQATLERPGTTTAILDFVVECPSKPGKRGRFSASGTTSAKELMRLSCISLLMSPKDDLVLEVYAPDLNEYFLLTDMSLLARIKSNVIKLRLVPP